MNEILKGCGVHHIALKANDFDKTCTFYKALGFKPVLEWGEGDKRGITLDVGDGAVFEIFGGGTDQPAIGRYTHVALTVNDVEEAVRIAVEAGGTLKVAPKTITIDGKPESIDVNLAFIKGLDGEEIEFYNILK